MTRRAARSTSSPEAPEREGLDPRPLRAVDGVVDLAHLVLRRTEGDGARDVGGVAADPAAGVDQDDVAPLERPIAGRSVGQGRRGPELDEPAALDAELAKLLLEDRGELALGHAARELSVRGLDREDRAARRVPDEGPLLGALDHAERVEERRRVLHPDAGEAAAESCVTVWYAVEPSMPTAFARPSARAAESHRILVLVPGHDLVDDRPRAGGFRPRSSASRGSARPSAGRIERGQPFASSDREVRRPGEVRRRSHEESVEAPGLRRSGEARLPLAKDVRRERGGGSGMAAGRRVGGQRLAATTPSRPSRPFPRPPRRGVSCPCGA